MSLLIAFSLRLSDFGEHLNRPLEINCPRLQTFYSTQENGKSLENCIRSNSFFLFEGYHHVEVTNEFTNYLFFATVGFSRALASKTNT